MGKIEYHAKMNVSDYNLFSMATNFRSAIEKARDLKEFDHNNLFNNFPNNCCGNASTLLAEYLNRQGIETILVSAERKLVTHAWLVVKDNRVRISSQIPFVFPEHIQKVLKSYGVEDSEKPLNMTRILDKDLENGVLIDITGDQFDDCNTPVFVDVIDAFHKSFTFINAELYTGLANAWIERIYLIIEQYL